MIGTGIIVFSDTLSEGRVFMDAALYTIQDRARNSSASFAKPEHFTLDEGQLVAPTLLVDEPGWTPYCLDDANRRVLFVNTPPEVDLSQAAFVYSAQFEHAQRALSVPYAALTHVTAAVEAPDTMIFIYSIGRCGSTLMSQLFNRVDGVYSLSEPDIYTDLSYLRKIDQNRDEEVTELLKACTLMLSRRENGSTPAAAALKFRSQGIELADLLHRAFPNAHSLFMYRQAESWAQSVFRFLQRLDYPNELSPSDAISLWHGLTGEDVAYVEPYVDDRADLIAFSDLLAPAWTSYLDRYMRQYERGVPFYTLRYEELNERREESLKSIFDTCGLPAFAVGQAMQGFETDSQAGTAIARDTRADDMTPEQIEQFLEVLSRHPRFNQPDFILPDSHDPRGVL
jgi:hypothetical protein